MKKSNHGTVRALLREHLDGLNICQISRLTGISKDSLRNTLHAMPDAHIDRWENPKRGQYAAVYCVVVPPPNCPHPKE